MAKPQILQTGKPGEDLVVLTRSEYLKLLARAGDEAAEDIVGAQIANERMARVKRGEDTFIPVEIWNAIEGGESAVRALRRHRGMTQAALAKASGVGQGFIADIEAGKKTGSPETLKALARALKVPLDALVG